jgi:serine/threonine-protein kinase
MTERPALDTAAWREAIAAFEALVDVPAAERAARLAELATARPALHAHVSSLLAADARAEAQGLLAAGALVDAERAVRDERRLRPGSVIGGRVLERPLGRGGMGEVWLAAGGEGEPEAAIKVLHPHLLLPAVRERFEREGRILASLSHPNVARLLDAGAEADGLLYLVLEYVPGERIDRWCDDRRLDIPARLELALQVCDAVAHAHSRLVLHRDLKPPNILATPDGRVKLLDFGIAKLFEADQDVVDATELTLLGGRALTPDYAAPEQVRGAPVTTATDVHALGVLLYLLLCGQRPFGAEDAPRAAVERAVLDTDPPPPSERCSAGSAAEALAARRSTTPAGLRRQLRGDLDNIVCKALRKDPAARYPTAVALADDLRRHLRREPVAARPASFAYQARRFAARHRTAVVTAALVTLALVGGLVGAAWQASEAREAARFAATQRDRAERVRAFLTAMFREQDPFSRSGPVAQGPAALVDRALDTLDAELGAEPGVRAELLGDLAEIRQHLGDYPAARRLLDRALVERRAWYGAASPQLAATKRAQANVLHFSGDVAGAARVAREALDSLDARVPGGALEQARLQERLAFYVAYGRGAPPDALALAEQALATLERELGPDDPETAVVLARYGQLLEQARRDDEAERVLRSAIERMQRRLGADTVRAWHPYRTLGAIEARSGRLELAASTYARANELLRRTFGEPNGMLAHTLVREADVQRQLGRLDAAFATYRAAERALPPGADDARSALLIQRGKLYLETGDLAAAEREMGEAFRLRRRILGEDNGLAWYTGSEWARALAALGRLPEAERVQREALVIVERQLGAQAFQVSLILDALAATVMRRGASAEAEALERRALSIVEHHHPPGHPAWELRARGLLGAMLANGAVRRRPAEPRALLVRWQGALTASATPSAATGPTGDALTRVLTRLDAGDGVAAERELRGFLAGR